MGLATIATRKDTLPLTVRTLVVIVTSMDTLQDTVSSLGGLGSQEAELIKALKISTSTVKARGLTTLRLKEPLTDTSQNEMLTFSEEGISHF